MPRQTLTIAQRFEIQHLDLAEREQLRVKFELKKAESGLAVVEARVNEAEGGDVLVAYRDSRYVIPFMVQPWMFATPSPTCHPAR